MRVCLWLLLCTACVSASPDVLSRSDSISGRPCNCTGSVLQCTDRRKSYLRPEEVCPTATVAQLSFNPFAHYPSVVTAFLTLHMGSDNLDVLPRASQLNAYITELRLAGNRIANETDELRSLAFLKVLYLENNLLQSLSFLPDTCVLEELHVDSNKISSLEGPLQFCTKLKVFKVHNNMLRTLPHGVFAAMVKLTLLSLSDNPLGTLAPDIFHGPAALEYLSLINTSLSVLPDHLFSGLPVLETLYLSDNQIEVFPASQLDGLNAITHLHVFGNRLTEVPVLRNCCISLWKARFEDNFIRAVSEEAVRSVLRSGRARLFLRDNPLRASALDWVLGARDLQPYAFKHDCACGGVRSGGASTQWCLRTRPVQEYSWPHTVAPCPADWIQEVRAAAGVAAGGDGSAEE